MGRRGLAVAFALLVSCGVSARGYSVLTHEAIIDSAWEGALLPLLKARFPAAADDDLLGAHAYAYGGCIIQDMGYYPFGSKLFSDLVHYTRTGDFIQNLIRESQTLDEYAFALGALAHFAADTNGHPIAVNRAVPIMYPKLERRYGPVVTYDEDRAAHIRTEFGFDVVQVARGSYAPKAYHDFIGFEVAKPVLERAFKDTYSLEFSELFTSVDLALGTYRHTVSTIIPETTRVAWELQKDEIVKARPGTTRAKFLYNVSRQSYEKEWGREYHRPGIGARVLAWVFRIVPRVGPFKALSYKAPNQQTIELFMCSFNMTLDRYRAFLAHVRSGDLSLPNLDFDTGQRAHAGEYSLADETYARLLEKLAKKEFSGVGPGLRSDILRFYGDLKAPVDTKKNEDQWHKTALALQKLRSLEAAPSS